MSDKEYFGFDVKDAWRQFRAGKLSKQKFADLLRDDIHEIELNITFLEMGLAVTKEREPENIDKQTQLKAMLDEYTAWLAKCDGIVVEVEHYPDRQRGNDNR